MKWKTKTLAMILAGGRVDELSVLTQFRPKSAVPFGGFARVIDFPLSNLMRSGLDLVAILSQYRCYSLINHIGIGAAWDMVGRHRGVSILPPFKGYDKSHWYRGSADAVFQNLEFIQYHDPAGVLILSGDHIYQMDYRGMIDYHWEKNADLTISCLKVPMAMAHRFGVAEIDDQDGERGGRIVRYEEKPAVPHCNWASMTVFCFKPKVLFEVLEANAREDTSYEFGHDIIPRMMKEQRRVFGYKFYDYWGYTRTIDEYWQTSMDLLGPEPLIRLEDWGIRTNLEHRGIRDCQPLKVGDGATIRDSLIYNGCVVEGHVERSILFPSVRIKKGASVKDSILFFNNTVGENCRMERVVSDVNNSFGPDTRIDEEHGTDLKRTTVIGWNTTIPAATVIGPGSIIHPNLKQDRIPSIIKAGEVVQ